MGERVKVWETVTRGHGDNLSAALLALGELVYQMGPAGGIVIDCGSVEWAVEGEFVRVTVWREPCVR